MTDDDRYHRLIAERLALKAALESIATGDVAVPPNLSKGRLIETLRLIAFKALDKLPEADNHAYREWRRARNGPQYPGIEAALKDEPR